MDGRPNSRNKAAFSNFSSVVWTRPKESASCAYLLLTEFEVHTVSYGPSFFLLRFMAQARSARPMNRRGKNEDP